MQLQQYCRPILISFPRVGRGSDGKVSRSAWTISLQCTQMPLMSGMMSKRTSVDATGKVCTFDIVSMVFVLIRRLSVVQSVLPQKTKLPAEGPHFNHTWHSSSAALSPSEARSCKMVREKLAVQLLPSQGVSSFL